MGLAACLAAGVAVARWHPLPPGFQLRSSPASDFASTTSEIDLRPLAGLPPPFRASWSGFWNVRRQGEHVLHVRAVDEAVRHHVVERAWLGEELEHRRVPAWDHGVELVEQAQELVAALDHAPMVERDVVVGPFLAHLHE